MNGPARQAEGRPDSSAEPESPTSDSLLDRLRAEAVRLLERDRGAPFEEPRADAAAVDGGGDFESRLLARARSLSVAPEIDRAIGHLRSGTVWVVVLVLLVAFLLGSGTARTTMAAVDGTRINFFWVLGGVLGVQTLLLLAWTGVAVRWLLRREGNRRESPMLLSLGRLVVTAGQWVAEKSGAGRHDRAAIRAVGRVTGSGRVGFWTFSSLTHAIWLSFTLGSLTLIVLLLSARQYTFVWETTILSEQHYTTMTQTLSAPPRALGFAVPTDVDIAGSQWTGEPMPITAPETEAAAEGRSQRWASLLVASILLYGAGPRLLLLGLSATSRQRASRSFRLDLSLPEYERLRPVLMPASRPLGVVDPDEAGRDARDRATGPAPSRPDGPPAIVGLEIGRPASGWPPPLEGVTFQDLGTIESREDRERVLRLLDSAEREPKPLLIVCELTTTPDRGIGRILESLRQTVTMSPVLLLTAGNVLRERGYDSEKTERRLEHWREAATRAGVEAESVLAVDLDHLTDTAAARLAERLGAGRASEPPRARRLEEASAVIERHAAGWEARDRPPTEGEQLALHREVASLYRTAATSPGSLFTLTSERSRAGVGDIKAGVTRFVDLLPPRLRANPKWLVAGALAGAFGCLATSALLTPVAMAALPSWSAVGAAVAAAFQGLRTGEEPPDALPGSAELSDAVRAAALFSVVLELQGRDEGSITRIIDKTFVDELSGPEDAMTNVHEVSKWLGAVRHRFDLAVASEERR